MDKRGKPGHSGAELGDTGTKRSGMINIGVTEVKPGSTGLHSDNTLLENSQNVAPPGSSIKVK